MTVWMNELYDSMTDDEKSKYLDELLNSEYPDYFDSLYGDKEYTFDDIELEYSCVIEDNNNSYYRVMTHLLVFKQTIGGVQKLFKMIVESVEYDLDFNASDKEFTEVEVHEYYEKRIKYIPVGDSK